MYSNNDGMDPNWKPSEDDSFTKYINQKKVQYLNTNPEFYNTVHVTDWAHEYVKKLEIEINELKLRLKNGNV